MTNLLFLALSLLAPGAEPQRITFSVGETQRQALVVVPEKIPDSGAPLVFVFHGHGGNARNASRRLAIHPHWPEAVVVYAQGLTGVPGITDPEGKQTGWQKNPGDVEDRDVKFVDVMLEELPKKHKIDRKRVYALGHSNGSRFVNVLWVMRGDRFAAFCTACGQGGQMLRNAKPKPVFVIAGEKDPLVPYEGQMRSVAGIRRLLGTDATRATVTGHYRAEPGKDGTELATYLHPGRHEFPQEALPLAAAFFRKHALP